MEKTLEIRISDILHDVGVPMHLKGYSYLMSALKLAQLTPGLINTITTKLYPQVAQLHETTASRVERSIRHAIKCAFDRASPDVTCKYFGNSMSGFKGKPTNGEFIATMSEWIRLERDL